MAKKKKEENATAQPSVVDLLCKQEFDPAVEINSIKPDPENPHKADEIGLLSTIKANKFYGAVLVRRDTRTIIAGEHRWKALIRAGAMTIPVLWMDIDGVQAMRIMLADNKTASGSYNDEMLMRACVKEIAGDQTVLSQAGLVVPTGKKTAHKVIGNTTVVKFRISEFSFAVDKGVFDQAMAQIIAEADGTDDDAIARVICKRLGIQQVRE